MNAIRKAFSDVLNADQEFFLKVQHKEWDGRFVDVRDGEALVDKSVVLTELKERMTNTTDWSEVGF